MREFLILYTLYTLQNLYIHTTQPTNQLAFSCILIYIFKKLVLFGVETQFRTPNDKVGLKLHFEVGYQLEVSSGGTLQNHYQVSVSFHFLLVFHLYRKMSECFG